MNEERGREKEDLLELVEKERLKAWHVLFFSETLFGVINFTIKFIFFVVSCRNLLLEVLYLA